MKIFHELNSDAFEGEDTTKCFLRLLLFLFVLLSFQFKFDLAVDYPGLNAVTPPLSAAAPDILELNWSQRQPSSMLQLTLPICYFNSFDSRMKATVSLYREG